MSMHARKMNPIPEWNWTPKEVAERYRVTEDAVRKWIYKGELGYIKAGARTLIPESELQKFQESSMKKAHSPAA